METTLSCSMLLLFFVEKRLSSSSKLFGIVRNIQNAQMKKKCVKTVYLSVDCTISLVVSLCVFSLK